MERFVVNDQSGTINRPVYGRYNIGSLVRGYVPLYAFFLQVKMDGVQQHRNSGLALNYGDQKNRSSDHLQNGQNFGLALNIGSSFSDCFQVLTAIQAPNSLGSLGCRKAK